MRNLEINNLVAGVAFNLYLTVDRNMVELWNFLHFKLYDPILITTQQALNTSSKNKNIGELLNTRSWFVYITQ